MESKIRQYFVAVSDDSLKLPTLVDLLLALIVEGPIGVAVSCSSRDSLDTVVGGISAVSQAEVTYLHADHSHEEVGRTLASFSKRLRSQAGPVDADRVTEDSEAADSSSAAAPDAVPETLYGSSSSPRERTGREDAGPGTAADSLTGQAKQTALAQVLVMTDVLFKSIDPHQIPAELELIIDFDVPLRKDLYARQLQLLAGHRGVDVSRQQIIIFFVVAGQIAKFRALETMAVGAIEIMPVHVSDIFSPTS